MPERLELTVEELTTPIGVLLVAADADGVLHAAEWADCRGRMLRQLAARHGPDGCALHAGTVAPAVAAALRGYFDGALAAIEALPVATAGTGFQRAVWAALRDIPAGRPMSYAALAGRLGRPGAARAVGHANGANPVAVVVPCHRLVGASGGLTGYAGGLDRKRWLLAHEAAWAACGPDGPGGPARH